MTTCSICARPIEEGFDACPHCGRGMTGAQAIDTPAQAAGAETAEPARGASLRDALRSARSSRWLLAGAAMVMFAAGLATLLVVGGQSRNAQASAPAPSVVPTPPATAQDVQLPGRTRTRAPRRAAPKWEHGRYSGTMHGGAKTIAFELAAEKYVPVWMNRVRPVLEVRCLAGTTDVYVTTHWAASMEDVPDVHTVQVGFDEGPDVAEQWLDAEDRRALFAPNGVDLARRIAGARRMRFGFTPFNAAPVVVDFDVSGFDQLVGRIAKACRWKPESPSQPGSRPTRKGRAPRSR
jgi:hypothetical protein